MHMTRENKLALVIGFALILFVGILISDHFSSVAARRSADLRPAIADPLAVNRHEDRELLDVMERLGDQRQNRANNSPVAVNPVQLQGQRPVANRRTEPQETVRFIEMGGTTPARGDSTGSPGSGMRFHDVGSDETLTQICRRYYGDDALVGDLARYNGLKNPNMVSQGRRLRIPDASDLVRGIKRPSLGNTDKPNAAQRPVAQKKSYEKYRVRSGDNLSEIAQRLLGSARRWTELRDLNRDVIVDEDLLIAGTVLRVPTP